MFRMLSAGMLLLSLASLSSASPDLSKMKPPELIKLLGDPMFRTREAASSELMRLGESSLDAIREGTRSTDAEIADRCRKLLPRLQEMALATTIERYIANPASIKPENAPGLKRWIEVCGTAPDSRLLYAEMARAHFRLLLDLEAKPARARELFLSFCQEKINTRSTTVIINGGVTRQDTIPLTDMVMYFYLGSHPQAIRNNDSITSTGYQLFNQTTLTTELAKPTANELRKLYLAWLETETNVTMIRRAIQVASTAKMKEMVPIALKGIRENKGNAVTSRALLLTSISQLGDKESLPLLKDLLADESVVTTVRLGNEPQTIQMRDVALGVAILWSGQNPRDFGFDRYPVGLKSGGSYTYFSFVSDEKRKKAHEQFAASLLKK